MAILANQQILKACHSGLIAVDLIVQKRAGSNLLFFKFTRHSWIENDVLQALMAAERNLNRVRSDNKLFCQFGLVEIQNTYTTPPHSVILCSFFLPALVPIQIEQQRKKRYLAHFKPWFWICKDHTAPKWTSNMHFSTTLSKRPGKSLKATKS